MLGMKVKSVRLNKTLSHLSLVGPGVEAPSKCGMTWARWASG